MRMQADARCANLFQEVPVWRTVRERSVLRIYAAANRKLLNADRPMRNRWNSALRLHAAGRAD